MAGHEADLPIRHSRRCTRPLPSKTLARSTSPRAHELLRTTLEAAGLPGAPAGGVDLVCISTPAGRASSCRSSFRGEAHLVLQYGHDLPIPIPDLEVDEYGVRATLSFSRAAHRTVIPWTAVYVVACVDGRGVLYSEDVPRGRVGRSPRARPSDAAERPTPDGDLESGRERRGRSRAGARCAPCSADPTRSPAADLGDAPLARRRRRPQLRLVK